MNLVRHVSGVRVLPVRVTQPVFAFLEQELTQDIYDKGNEKCVTCLLAQKCGDQSIVLTCSHAFHKECVRPWLAAHTTCPVCRADAETGERQATTPEPDAEPDAEPEPEPDCRHDCPHCGHPWHEFPCHEFAAFARVNGNATALHESDGERDSDAEPTTAEPAATEPDAHPDN